MVRSASTWLALAVLTMVGGVVWRRSPSGRLVAVLASPSGNCQMSDDDAADQKTAPLQMQDSE